MRAGRRCWVARNDQISLEEIEAMAPQGIVVSPGPRTPKEAGISAEVVARFGEKLPVLGVCLGHQTIGYTYGAVVEQAPEIMHGKTSMVYHDGKGLYEGLPNPFEAIRYHSLIVNPESLPEFLEVTSRTEDGIVMGVRHKSLPVEGVQFHPESIMTKVGHDLLRNYLNRVKRWAEEKGANDD